ncbi:MAG TPA: family 16 glycosylhydrolase [Hanamia sp.]|nr:family 16 glycosylhydrolase [Hanamia sp.]
MIKIEMFITVFSLLVFSACGKKSSGSDWSAPVLSITDVQQARDNSDTTTFHFVVNLSKASSKEINVDYTTVDGTANENYFIEKSGTLTIPANQTSGGIDIEVKGDSLREAAKIFYVQLSNLVNANITGFAKGIGTIYCDGTYLPVNDSGYVAPTSYPGLALKWSDEFNEPTINNNTWNYDLGAGGWGNNELETYTNSTKNSFITDGGYLVLEARQEPFGSANYTSARMLTMGKQQFQYGRIDVRAILPKGQGIWPAIWMLGSNISTTPWPTCGEIDMMELLGNQPDKVYGTAHWGNAGQSAESGGNYTLPSGDFSQEFHVFSISWDSTKIQWYVDNQLYYTVNKTDVVGTYPFDQPFFFILNIAVGGAWPGNPDNTTVFPQRMIVDYVRVYQ